MTWVKFICLNVRLCCLLSDGILLVMSKVDGIIVGCFYHTQSSFPGLLMPYIINMRLYIMTVVNVLYNFFLSKPLMSSMAGAKCFWFIVLSKTKRRALFLPSQVFFHGNFKEFDCGLIYIYIYVTAILWSGLVSVCHAWISGLAWSMCACMCLCVCVWVCMCVYVCMYICVCVCN